MPIPLNLTNIQGNCPGGFNKDFQSNLFLKFTNSASGRSWLKEIAEQANGKVYVPIFSGTVDVYGLTP
jgi:hypothetical protein